MAECRCSPCGICRGSRGKVRPRSSTNSGVKQINQTHSSTKVEIEREDAGSDHDGVEKANSQWTVPGIFKSIFHVSADNKLAVKLYGSKKGLLLQKKHHESGSNKWMIHPFSHFRYDARCL